MNAVFAFLGLLLTLLMGHSSAFHRNQACSQLSDYGNCTGFARMWAYSRYDRSCYPFAYSTCGGNTNRFLTREDCEKACNYVYQLS